MASSDRLRIRLWCEDSRHESFVRRFLRETYGVENRQLHVQKAPKGKGDAASWVIEQYPNLARLARREKSQQRLGFLLVVDGDSKGVSARKHAIFRQFGSRADNDRIAVWIPTWNIETWILWLNEHEVDGEDVSESRSFKSEFKDEREAELIRSAVKAWDSPRTDEATRVPSLIDARKELARIT